MERPSGTVTFLFTDVEGSTRLWEDHPEEMAGVLADHDHLLGEAIESHGGRVFSTAGDAFAAVFPSAIAAVEAAIAVQGGTGGFVAGGEPVRVRMAVHTGEVEERDGGFFGPVLNRCARLRDAAHGGQILISLAAEELLADRRTGPISVLDLGEHRLRDLSRPERVFQIRHPDLQDGFPPLRSLAGLSTNLPIQVTSFVGRVQESAELEKLIRGSRLVTVTGAGGCGKSRLAVQVTAEMLGEFGDGVWLIELASLSDPELLASSVMTALGIREQPGLPPLDSLTGYLRHKTVLLVVDNCEHLIAPIADLVAHLLSHTSNLRVVATSREPLHIRGEAIYQLPTLPVPEADDDWNTLVRTDSVRLFAERADAAQPGFRVTHTNAPAVASICTHLDGIPLAVELAASASRFLSPDQINDHLGNRFRLLTGGARDDLDHHRTLEAAIDWSYQLLIPEQQTLFARLAVFAGAFTVEAAEAVCSDEANPTADVVGAVVQLADRSLLETEETDSGVRYRMLETIRAYATAQLRALPDSFNTQLDERHYRYFLSAAEEVTEGPVSQTNRSSLALLDAATPDIRQALAWAAGSGQDQYAVDIAGALGWYWKLRSRTVEAVHWYRSVPLHSEEVPVRSRIRALRFAARHLAGAGAAGAGVDFTAARELAVESLRLARQTGDQDLIVASLYEIGHVCYCTGEPQTVSILEEGLAVAEAAGNVWYLASIRNIFAHFHYDAAQYLLAKAFFKQNLEDFRRLGDTRSAGMTLGFLGSIARRQGDLDTAHQLNKESLKIGRHLGDFMLLSTALAGIGQTHYLKGELDAAKALHEEEAEITRRTTGSEDLWALYRLGFTTRALGDFGSAGQHFRRALMLLREVQDPDTTTVWATRRTLWGVALVLAQEANTQPAAVLLAAVEAADHVLPPWIDPHYEPAVHRTLVDLIESSLSREVLRQAQQEGAAMTLDQATDYALKLLDNPAAE